MIRVTRRAWPELGSNGKIYFVIWKPKTWGHRVMARVGGSKQCHKSTKFLLIPPKAPLFGIFIFNPFRTWCE